MLKTLESMSYAILYIFFKRGVREIFFCRYYFLVIVLLKYNLNFPEGGGGPDPRTSSRSAHDHDKLYYFVH